MEKAGSFRCVHFMIVYILCMLLEYNKITIISPYLFKIIGLNFALFLSNLCLASFHQVFVHLFVKIELFIIPAPSFFFLLFHELFLLVRYSVYRFAFSFLSHKN